LARASLGVRCAVLEELASGHQKEHEVSS
jgi:hypothetical protein